MPVKIIRRTKVLERRTLLPEKDPATGKTIYKCEGCGMVLTPGGGKPCRCGTMKER